MTLLLQRITSGVLSRLYLTREWVISILVIGVGMGLAFGLSSPLQALTIAVAGVSVYCLLIVIAPLKGLLLWMVTQILLDGYLNISLGDGIPDLSLTRLCIALISVLLVAVPAAQLPAGVPIPAAQGPGHKIIVIGGDVNGQRQVGQDTVGLTGHVKVGRDDGSEAAHELVLGKHGVTLDGQELGYTGQVPRIGQGIAIVSSPLLSDLGAQGDKSSTGPRAKKGCAIPIPDPAKKAVPVSVFQILHWLTPCEIVGQVRVKPPWVQDGYLK